VQFHKRPSIIKDASLSCVAFFLTQRPWNSLFEKRAILSVTRTTPSNLAKKANVGVAEIEANFFKNERPGSLLLRFATVEEVANLILYYSSPLSSATNGAAIRVDGGVVRSIL